MELIQKQQEEEEEHSKFKIWEDNILDDFDDKYPSSAGILCYSITPMNEIFFLLGKESEDELNYPDRSFWSDFAGGIENNETEEEAAAREFCEESLHCVPLDTIHIEPKEIKMEEITKSLLRKDYTMKLKVCMNHGAPNSVPRKYHCAFVKQIPWNPQLPKIFDNVREKMSSIKSHYEKAQFYKKTDENPDYSETYMKMAQSNYDKLPPSLKDHPCIMKSKDNGYTIPDFYLEKTSIQYWSIERLSKMISRGGCYYAENLRLSFIPVIAVVIDRFIHKKGKHYKIYCHPDIKLLHDLNNNN